MKTTFNITFVCRPSKATKSGRAPVEMAITLNGERCILTLPRKEFPKEFAKAIKAKKTNPIKEYCEQQYTDIQNYCFQMQQKHIPLTIPNIRKFIQTGCADTYTLGNLFSEYFELLNIRKEGGDLSKGAYVIYERAKKYFLEHGADENTELINITTAEIQKFTTWLSTSFENSTAVTLYRKIQTIFTYAFNAGKITSNPTALVKIKRLKKEAVYLTEDELNKIATTDYANESLNHYRDIFVFQCHTCLSYSDLKSLKQSDIKENEFGKFIQKKRIKTGVEYTVLLDAYAFAILVKYDYDLKVPSDQKYNTYLKHLAKIAGIKKNITTHTARHTGATMLLNNGTPIETVAKVLGHTNTNQTKEYARMLDITVLQDLAGLEERKQERQQKASIVREQQEKVLMLKNLIERYKNEEMPSDEELEQIADEIIMNEPFNGSLEMDFLEQQYVDGDITEEEYKQKLIEITNRKD